MSLSEILHRVADMLDDREVPRFSANICAALVLAIVATIRTSPQDQAERVRNIGRIMDGN